MLQVLYGNFKIFRYDLVVSESLRFWPLVTDLNTEIDD